MTVPQWPIFCLINTQKYEKQLISVITSKLPAVKVGREWRFPREKIIKAMVN